MDQPFFVSLATLAALFVVAGLGLFILSGADRRKLCVACRCFHRALRDNTFQNQVEPLLAPPPKDQETSRPSGLPLRLLALLQREGRLVDFLLENIQAYPDAQIGAAVRDIHRKCQAALKEHLVLEQVLPQSEGAVVEVPAGFDPSAIRLTGNVTGQPPFRGTLQHHGWRVKEIKLGELPAGQDDLVLMPAEVELPGA